MKKDDENEKLKQKIKELEAKLEYVELKGRAYQIMVEIAKEQYNIDLEKKVAPNAQKIERKVNKSK